MHFVPLRGGFCIRVPGEDIDFAPLGAMFLVLDALVTQPFLWLGFGWSSNGVLSNMNVAIVRACMFWQWDTLEHERHYGLGRDALVIGCCRT